MPPAIEPTPVIPTPAPNQKLIFTSSPPRPTPTYFAPPATALPTGTITTALPTVPTVGPGLSVLYLNGTLHVWRVNAARDDDLGWPDAAIECAWLAPDGHTLYFSDAEGAKRIDLTTPEPPQLLVPHFVSDPNPARHRRFCITDQSDDGSRLLLQARDQRWYQWGVLQEGTQVLRVVESPFGPPGEPWHCPGAALWGQGNVLFVTGYSKGRCNQFPGFHITHWGGPLVPTAVVTSTLPPLGEHLHQLGGAWTPVRSPDGRLVAFWLDEDWAREDGAFFQRVLYVINADGSSPRPLTPALPNGGGGGPPAWSADSQVIYYVTSQPFDSLDPHEWQIHRLSVVDGQDEIVQTLVTRHIVIRSPEYRHQLLLQILNDDFDYQLHVLDLNSGELLNGPALVTVLGWLRE